MVIILIILPSILKHFRFLEHSYIYTLFKKWISLTKWIYSGVVAFRGCEWRKGFYLLLAKIRKEKKTEL